MKSCVIGGLKRQCTERFRSLKNQFRTDTDYLNVFACFSFDRKCCFLAIISF